MFEEKICFDNFRICDFIYSSMLHHKGYGTSKIKLSIVSLNSWELSRWNLVRSLYNLWKTLSLALLWRLQTSFRSFYDFDKIAMGYVYTFFRWWFSGSRSELFCKNFAKFREKHLRQSVISNKVAGFNLQHY